MPWTDPENALIPTTENVESETVFRKWCVMSVKVAVIGLGIMGQRMLGNMAKHSKYDLVAAWDPSQPACQATKENYPEISIANNAAEAITRDDVDVVYIASPPASHREYAEMAANAGKAVFCEKPLGVDLEDSRKLVSAVEATGVPNAVNFPFAQSAAINKMQAAISAGKLGDILRVELNLHFSKWPRGWQHEASWLSERAEGGFIREVGSHYVYLVQKLFGQAEIEHCHVSYPDDPKLCETHFYTSFKSGDLPIVFNGAAGGSGPDRVEFIVWGSDKSYRLWDWVNLHSSNGGEWENALPEIEDPREVGYVLMLDGFIDCLKGDAQKMASLHDAFMVQELVEKILN